MKNTASIAKLLIKRNQGIFAIDESLQQMLRRFVSANILPVPGSRRAYRELIIDTPHLNDYIRGIIMTDEAARQLDSDGDIFAQRVIKRGFLLGIRADLGNDRAAIIGGDYLTRPRPNLHQQLQSYKKMGATFTKWNSLYRISNNMVHPSAIEYNNQQSVEFVHIAQAADILPILHIEVLREGNHSLEVNKASTETILDDLFHRLIISGVDESSLVIKMHFLTPSKNYPKYITPSMVAQETIDLILSVIPKKIGGVVFLANDLPSGAARMYYHALFTSQIPLPIPISYSFGQGLSKKTFEQWGGNSSRVQRAQVTLIDLARRDAQAGVIKRRSTYSSIKKRITQKKNLQSKNKRKSISRIKRR